MEPNNFPSTFAVARHHSFRVFCQIKQWKGEEIDPEKWGWNLQENQIIPITTDLSPAMDSLLKVLGCNCKSKCNTLRCLCRKHGLECFAVRGH